MTSASAPYELMVLYRGPLESCNYGCGYCPFAKQKDSKESKLTDSAALEKFVLSVGRQPQSSIGIFFTPWGEALIHPRYRRAMVALARLPQVQKVAIQTNLSLPPKWLEALPRKVTQRLGFWATYHPGEVQLDKFLQHVHTYVEHGCKVSVGGVALDGHKDALTSLSQRLPPSVPFWVNAAKRVHGGYDSNDMSFWTDLDPTFPTNTEYHRSLGARCKTGEDVISVDGAGLIRRCHFVDDVLGNFFTDDVSQCLRPRPCTRSTCGCHIGYVHLEKLKQRALYADGLLERRRLPIAHDA